ncbi:transcriptional regulator swi6 [Thoreauomyces humboldtii]|nr:transcriptional regulator swi6 [Thoreauomyces humboldtii]
MPAAVLLNTGSVPPSFASCSPLSAAEGLASNLPALILPQPPPTPPPTYPTALVPPQPNAYEPWNDPRYALPPLQDYRPVYVQAPGQDVRNNNLAAPYGMAFPPPRSHIPSAQQANRPSTNRNSGQQQQQGPSDHSQQLQQLLTAAAASNALQGSPTTYGAGGVSSYSTQQQQQHLEQAPSYYAQPSSHMQNQEQSGYYSPVPVPAFRPSNFTTVPLAQSPGGVGSLGDGNGNTKRPPPALPSRTPATRPGLWEATYSNTPVYEMNSPNGVGVMRRKSDSWMNATQIIKAADIDKSKRTKILERDVHVGVHEKIQGGYGKYQGTWIPLNRAKELALEYNLANALNTILDMPE